MKDFRTRKKVQVNPFHSWFFLFVLVILFVLFVRSAYASFAKKSQASIEQSRYEEDLESLIEKKLNLELKIENLKSARGLEEEFRKRYNVVREGETMIRIIRE